MWRCSQITGLPRVLRAAGAVQLVMQPGNRAAAVGVCRGLAGGFVFDLAPRRLPARVMGGVNQARLFAPVPRR